MNKHHISFSIGLLASVTASLIGADKPDNLLPHEGWPWPTQFIPETKDHFKEVTLLMFGSTPPFCIAHVEHHNRKSTLFLLMILEHYT
jgi:hypothetical protein